MTSKKKQSNNHPQSNQPKTTTNNSQQKAPQPTTVSTTQLTELMKNQSITLTGLVVTQCVQVDAIVYQQEKKDRENLTTENNNLKKQIIEMQSENNKLLENIDFHKRTLDEFRQKNIKLEETHAKKIDDLKKENEDLRIQLKKLTEENANLVQKNKELDDKVNTLTTNVIELTNNNITLTNDVAKLTTVVRKQEKDVAELVARNTQEEINKKNARFCLAIQDLNRNDCLEKKLLPPYVKTLRQFRNTRNNMCHFIDENDDEPNIIEFKKYFLKQQLQNMQKEVFDSFESTEKALINELINYINITTSVQPTKEELDDIAKKWNKI